MKVRMKKKSQDDDWIDSESYADQKFTIGRNIARHMLSMIGLNSKLPGKK